MASRLSIDRPASGRSETCRLPKRTADRLAVGANQQRLTGYLHGLLHGADLQLHVLPKSLRGQKLDAGDGRRLKAWLCVRSFRRVPASRFGIE